jgi:hypothetical protein
MHGRVDVHVCHGGQDLNSAKSSSLLHVAIQCSHLVVNYLGST